MKTFRRDEFRVLAEHHEHPLVSILMPVDPVAVGLPDVIRLKTLLQDARDQLVRRGMRGPDADVMLEPASALLEDVGFWRQGGRGLACYLGPGFHRTYRVPLALPEVVVIGDEFHLKPLFRLLHGDGTFYVLSISANGNRLLECSRLAVRRIDVPGAPVNLDEATQYIEESQPMNRTSHAVASAGGRRGGAPALHLQGFGEEHRKHNELMDYFRAVDAAIRPVLSVTEAPLVFAGIERNFALYQQVTAFPRNLVEPAVIGNPDFESDEELRDRAWSVVEPVFLEPRHIDASRYLHRRGGEIVAHSLRDVLPAAAFGRVETLFVADREAVFGRFDPDDGTVEVHDTPEPGDKDLVNEAALLALKNGANVYAVDPDELPAAPVEGRAAVNAILRW